MTIRLQIDFQDDRMHQLEKLMDDCAIETKKELINAALTLLTWAVRERMKGRVILSFDESSKVSKEIEMPALLAAAERAQRSSLNLSENLVPDKPEDVVRNKQGSKRYKGDP